MRHFAALSSVWFSVLQPYKDKTVIVKSSSSSSSSSSPPPSLSWIKLLICSCHKNENCSFHLPDIPGIFSPSIYTDIQYSGLGFAADLSKCLAISFQHFIIAFISAIPNSSLISSTRS